MMVSGLLQTPKSKRDRTKEAGVHHDRGQELNGITFRSQQRPQSNASCVLSCLIVLSLVPLSLSTSTL